MKFIVQSSGSRGIKIFWSFCKSFGVVMHLDFPWRAVLKIFGIVSTNFPTILLRGYIHVWEKCKTYLQDFFSKVQVEFSLKPVENPSFDCSFLFFFAMVNFRLRLILVLVILFVSRQYIITLVIINPNKLLNNLIVLNLEKKKSFYDRFWLVSMQTEFSLY